MPDLLDPPPPLEISKSDYLSIVKSRTVLNAAFSIEENYDLVIGNYLELEKTALSISTSAIARHFSEYQELFELRAEMNRRAVNLLSTARLFVDQLPQWFNECGHNAEHAKQYLRREYDSNFEYRFMEALRNHVQHSGLAVHSVKGDSKWIPPGRPSRIEFSFKVLTLRSFLKQDRSFKQTVLEECPEQVDFLSATRRYLESFGVVQEGIRTAIEPAVTGAREIFAGAIQKYIVFSSNSALGLSAFGPPNTESENKVPVFLDWDDVRIKLTKRNGTLTNLTKFIITSASY